jgi:putative transcriptional regulator
MKKHYQYKGCALRNVYLANGYEVVKTPYGKGVTIHELEGLHAALGCIVVSNSAPLTGDEFRFLRQELELSQAALGAILGRDEQAVARWEKGHSKRIDPVADRFMRVLYQQDKMGAKKLTPALDVLRKLEATPPTAKKIVVREQGEKWKACTSVATA